MSKGRTLVISQFVLIVLIILQGGLIANSILGMELQIIGFLIGIKAIYDMKIGNLAINPEPKTDAKLVQSGIYKVVRHPMYLSILTFLLPVAINFNNVNTFVSYLILVFVLIIKIQYEEELLIQKFSKYSDYIKETKRLIPYIY